jgi:glycine cleavage system H protein
MKIDETCKYAETHEWIRVEGDEGVCGISDHAQEQLSDVVYVELPEEGDTFDQGEVYATVESVKAAADVYMPVSGEILEINEALEEAPELVNQDPFGEAWLVRIRIADKVELDDLLDPDAYAEVVETEMAEGH